MLYHLLPVLFLNRWALLYSFFLLPSSQRVTTNKNWYGSGGNVLSYFILIFPVYCTRENVAVEESISGNVEYDTNKCGTEKESLSFAAVAEMLKQGQFPSALESSNAKTPDFSVSDNHYFAASVSGAYQASLFEQMCLIATKSDDERVRCESLSIMNLILMRHNAYSERDK